MGLRGIVGLRGEQTYTGESYDTTRRERQVGAPLSRPTPLPNHTPPRRRVARPGRVTPSAAQPPNSGRHQQLEHNRQLLPRLAAAAAKLPPTSRRLPPLTRTMRPARSPHRARREQHYGAAPPTPSRHAYMPADAAIADKPSANQAAASQHAPIHPASCLPAQLATHGSYPSSRQASCLAPSSPWWCGGQWEGFGWSVVLCRLRKKKVKRRRCSTTIRVRLESTKIFTSVTLPRIPHVKYTDLMCSEFLNHSFRPENGIPSGP